MRRDGILETGDGGHRGQAIRQDEANLQIAADCSMDCGWACDGLHSLPSACCRGVRVLATHRDKTGRDERFFSMVSSDVNCVAKQYCVFFV